MVLQDEAWACGAFQVARRKAPFRSGDGLPDERLEGCENSTSLRRRDTGELVHGFSCRCHGPGEYGYLIALLFLFGGVFCARLHSGAFCCIESVRSRSSSLDFQLKLGPSLFPWHCPNVACDIYMAPVRGRHEDMQNEWCCSSTSTAWVSRLESLICVLDVEECTLVWMLICNPYSYSTLFLFNPLL